MSVQRASVPTDPTTPTVHPCVVCGAEEGTNRCSQCKRVWYCGRKCQVQDWKQGGHKEVCRQVQTCDMCKNPDTTNFPSCACCFACGFLFCEECGEQYNVRDDPSRYAEASYKGSAYHGNIIKVLPCPSCGDRTSLDFRRPENWKRLQRLIDEKQDDPRCGRWMTQLGAYYRDNGVFYNKMIKLFLEAGEAGDGEGYSRLGDLYGSQDNWKAAKKYYELAAELKHEVALHCLSIEARDGYFYFNENWWGPKDPNERSPIDPKKCVKLNRKACKLMYPPALGLGALIYSMGMLGEEVDGNRAVDYAILSMEKGEKKSFGVIQKWAGLGHEKAKTWLEENGDKFDMEDTFNEFLGSPRALALFESLCN